MQKWSVSMPLCLVVFGSFIASICAPLLTYSLSLAVFGIAHVISELRYVDERFGRYIGKRFAVVLAALLVGVVALRVCIIVNIIPAWRASTCEIILVFVISLYSAYLLRRAGQAIFIALFFTLSLFLGILISPTSTLLILALLHNITPIGFIVERTPRPKQRAAFGLSVIVFVAIPLYIATGAPRHFFDAFFGLWPESSVLSTGPLALHLGVFLPKFIRDSTWALDAFSAAAFAQCMHYVAVIHVLPRMSAALKKPGETATSYFPWPTSKVFLISIAVSSAFFFIGFMIDFTIARSIYGIFAAVHAWLEIPLLLLAIAYIKAGFRIPAKMEVV